MQSPRAICLSAPTTASPSRTKECLSRHLGAPITTRLSLRARAALAQAPSIYGRAAAAGRGSRPIGSGRGMIRALRVDRPAARISPGPGVDCARPKSRRPGFPRLSAAGSQPQIRASPARRLRVSRPGRRGEFYRLADGRLCPGAPGLYWLRDDFWRGDCRGIRRSWRRRLDGGDWGTAGRALLVGV